MHLLKQLILLCSVEKLLITGFGTADLNNLGVGQNIHGRIRPMIPGGFNLPGNKGSAGAPQSIPGIQLPGQVSGDTKHTPAYPFQHIAEFGYLQDRGDSLGVGLAFTPVNPLKLDIPLLYPAIMKHRGLIPRFSDDPLIGPFDPFTRSFGWGIAYENQDPFYKGGISFPMFKRGYRFVLSGGISPKSGKVDGKLNIPLVNLGKVWPLKYNFADPTRSDVNVNHGQTVHPVNPLKIPFEAYAPYVADRLNLPSYADSQAQSAKEKQAVRTRQLLGQFG